MAGAGSRLRNNESSLPKPLLPVLGRALISYTLEAIARAGIENVYAVVGFESELIIARTRPLIPSGLNVRFIPNPQWQKQNGLSVLSVAGQVRPPFLLTMSDHIYDETVLDILIRNAKSDALNLAVDRKLASIFDVNDAMKVQTRGDQIVAIGKDLQQYDAIDTGAFVCPGEIFDYLTRAKKEGDCSLADGVRLAAAEGKACVVDVKNGWWQDVDTPEMLAQAEQHLQTSFGGKTADLVVAPPDRRNSSEGKADEHNRRPQMKNPLR
jgi:choline kinase